MANEWDNFSCYVYGSESKEIISKNVEDKIFFYGSGIRLCNVTRGRTHGARRYVHIYNYYRVYIENYLLCFSMVFSIERDEPLKGFK